MASGRVPNAKSTFFNLFPPQLRWPVIGPSQRRSIGLPVVGLDLTTRHKCQRMHVLAQYTQLS